MASKITTPVREYPPSKNRLMIIDWGSLSYHQLWALKSAKNNTKDINTAADEVREWKAGMIRRVLDAIRIFNPLDIIIALEGTKTWRHDVFKEYYTKNLKITYSKDGYFVHYDNDISWVRKENGNIIHNKIKDRTNIPTPEITLSDISEVARNAIIDALPKYKGSRQKKPWEFFMAKSEFNNLRNSFANDVSRIFRAHSILFDSAEGDDIIAVACQTHHITYESIILMTRDSDMNQLLTYNNLAIYNHLSGEMTECRNPSDYLNVKILSGDDSDSIPGIAIPTRKTKLGEAGALTLYESLGGTDCYTAAKNGGWENQYIRNRQLIDLSFIPEVIKTNIKEKLLQPQPDFCPFWDIQTMGIPELTINEISKIKSIGYYCVNPRNSVINNPGIFNQSKQNSAYKKENEAKVITRIGHSSSYGDFPDASQLL